MAASTQTSRPSRASTWAAPPRSSTPPCGCRAWTPRPAPAPSRASHRPPAATVSSVATFTRLVARQGATTTMSKTLMRGLALLETIDQHGPLTVMELVRDTRIDKSIVSRTLTALEREGWVVRNEGKVELGPRAALLGHSSQAAMAVRRAEPLVHAVAGVTGLLTQAYGLVGSRAL